VNPSPNLKQGLTVLTNQQVPSPFARRNFLRGAGLLLAGTGAAPLLAACGNSGSSGSKALTVWWNQGFYPSEDEAVTQVAMAWGQKTGHTVDLQFYGTNDIPKKEASAVASGNVPDIIHAEKGLTQRYAWEGRLADVSEVVQSQQLTDGALRAARLHNNKANKTSDYSVPIFQFTVSLFYWRSLLRGIGLDPAAIPTDWAGYWDFWKQAQREYRARGNNDIHAVGWPMGTAAGDTNYDTQQVLRAYGAELLDDQNAPRDTPEVRQAMADGLSWIADLYKQGYSPQDSLNWQDSSNNTYFLNRSVLLTPNGSLSMPGAIKDKNRDQWQDIVTTGFPNRPGGGEQQSLTLTHNAVVFEQSAKKDMAIDFLKYMMQPENTLAILKGGQARWFPVHKQLLADPYFAQSEDPNIQAVTKQLIGKTVPQWADLSPAFNQAENGMQVWGNAIGRVVLQGQSPQQGTDFALNLIKQQFDQFKK
jgi:multiple sugar transport system substrate-binding protein